MKYQGFNTQITLKKKPKDVLHTGPETASSIFVPLINDSLDTLIATSSAVTILSKAGRKRIGASRLEKERYVALL